MANKEIFDLTVAAALTGTELVHVVQGGNSRKTTVADMNGSNSISFLPQTASFNVTNAMMIGGVIVEVNSATAVNATIPAALTGTEPFTVVQIGAGKVTFVASGTTILALGSLLTTKGAGAIATVYRNGTDIYRVGGGLE